ncbi:MAG: hypothetical protein M1818_002365 [Claussenomyces sp. TS43310]|nr:MAG: hypothetical protein M1818_002365 [Claussenomyces sp. TS43310]
MPEPLLPIRIDEDSKQSRPLSFPLPTSASCLWIPSSSIIMFAQRGSQQALRRLVASKPSVISQLAARNVAAPLALAPISSIRPVSTQKLTPADSYQILVEQRKRRPTSPHLSIYRPQITWFASGFNRITGITLSAGFYVFGTAYLVAPLFGWHLESASLAAAFGAWPVAAKVATKFALAFPFTYHSLNGVRHLVWDTASQFSNKQVIRSGWTVVGLSVTSAIYLATMV